MSGRHCLVTGIEDRSSDRTHLRQGQIHVGGSANDAGNRCYVPADRGGLRVVGYPWGDPQRVLAVGVRYGHSHDQTGGKRLHDAIMSVGNSVDPGEAYRNFRGRDPKIDALLRARGFTSNWS